MDAWLEGPYFVAWLSKFKITYVRQVAPCATKPLNYQQMDDLLLQIMVKGKNMVILLLKEKKILNLNLLKPFPTLKLLIIISKHWTILSQGDSPKAEIIWLLKYVMSVCSLRFNEDLEDTLCVIYPWLGSVKNFSMARSMSMYSVNHRLAPYFKTLLQTILEKSETFSSYPNIWNGPVCLIFGWYRQLYQSDVL